MPRTPENIHRYAVFAASFCQTEGFHCMDKTGVAALVEHGVRLAGRTGKLSTRFSEIANIMREANYWAGRMNRAGHRPRGGPACGARRRRTACACRRRSCRSSSARGRSSSTPEGKVVGQINGLSYYDAGRLRLRQAGPHHRADGAGPRRAHQHRARGRDERPDLQQGDAHHRGVVPRALRAGLPPHLQRLDLLRAELRRHRGGQRLGGRDLRAPLLAFRGAAAAGSGRDRQRQPARRRAADRRGEREDRGVLRRLPRARSDRHAGRGPAGGEPERV